MHLLIVTLSVAQCSDCRCFRDLNSTTSVHDGFSYLTMSECSYVLSPETIPLASFKRCTHSVKRLGTGLHKSDRYTQPPDHGCFYMDI